MTVLEVSQDELERVRYEDRQKWHMDLKSSSAYMRRKGYEEGYKEGYEKGYKAGYENSIKSVKKFVVQRLLERSYSIQDVVELTELTMEEIESIKNTVNT